jgi:hypothetical protein
MINLDFLDLEDRIVVMEQQLNEIKETVNYYKYEIKELKHLMKYHNEKLKIKKVEDVAM